MANHTFFAFNTPGKINSFAYINSAYINSAFMIFNLQKDCHQDNLPLVCLHFYKYNCLNILADNICFCTQVKNQ